MVKMEFEYLCHNCAKYLFPEIDEQTEHDFEVISYEGMCPKCGLKKALLAPSEPFERIGLHVFSSTPGNPTVDELFEYKHFLLGIEPDEKHTPEQ